jgi:hypothetical protein
MTAVALFASVLSGGTMLPLAHAEPVRSAVLGLPAPARPADEANLSTRVRAVAEQVARGLSAPLVSGAELTPRLDLSARFAEARALTVNGSLDEAAVILDVGLEEGLSQLDRLVDPADLIAAHVRRISIALARGEKRRAVELLDRVLRLAPALELESTERSPALVAALTEARARPAPDLRPEDLGEAVRTFAVVITARVIDAPSAPGRRALEFLRFDEGRPTGRMLATDESDAQVAAVLARAAAPPALALVHRSSSPSVRPGRALRIAGLTVGGLGLGLLAIGTYFGVDAKAQADGIGRGCQPSMPCAGDLLDSRAQALRNAEVASAVLWAGGGLALASGVVLFAVGSRRGVTKAVAARAE